MDLGLRRVMANGGYNVVVLTEDRVVYFDKDNDGKYGLYDIGVLEDKEEIFDRVILLSREPSLIEESIARKKFLNENLFVDTDPSDRNQSTCEVAPIPTPLDELQDETITNTSTFIINSIVNLKDDENCQFSFEYLRNSPCLEFALDQLQDDNEMIGKSTSSIENTSQIIIDEAEEQEFNYYQRSMLTYQQSILDHQQSILDQLETMNTRLIAVEESVSLLYERQSMTTIVKLLNEVYLIDIRQLDTRILASSESKEMNLFFHYVAKSMTNDYSFRWKEIEHWLCLSTQPRSIEFNLLGFGKLNKKSQQNQIIKIIQSPVKSTDIIRYGNRPSYVTSENSLGDNDKTLIIIFEATTSKIYLTSDVLSNRDIRNDKYGKSIKKLIHKLCQLERQIYYLSFYYSIGLHQFFAGLVLFELYRNPSVNPDELTNKIMESEMIQQYAPLLFRLFKLDQFILTY